MNAIITREYLEKKYTQERNRIIEIVNNTNPIRSVSDVINQTLKELRKIEEKLEAITNNEITLWIFNKERFKKTLFYLLTNQNPITFVQNRLRNKKKIISDKENPSIWELIEILKTTNKRGNK